MRKLHEVSLIDYSSRDKRYDLGEVGRYRINRKLKMDTPDHVKGFNKRRYHCDC